MSLHSVELSLLVLVFFVGALALLARQMKTPYPIVLVVGGLLLSFVPHVPKFTLNPDLVFVAILPPLLLAAGYNTSWHDFRFNLVSICMLAFGLVAFTVVCSAVAAHWFLPGFDWRAGLVLGAVIATTDAIAATSIGQRLGLPRQLLSIIEGESLVNDATGLLALQFALAIYTTGQIPSLAHGAAELLWLVCGGVAVGLGVGWVIAMVQTPMQDVQLQILVTLVTPYVSYLLGESVHASGILAVVTTGIFIGRRASVDLTSSARINAAAVWDTLQFSLNGFVFILIGLQLPQILNGIREVSMGLLVRDGLIVGAMVIALRLIWVLPGAHVSYFIRQRILRQEVSCPDRSSLFIEGWSGMRGVVALAAAFSLPVTMADGSPFAHRNLIIFLTFCVIFVTLVLQGLTLPFFISRLGLSHKGGDREEEIRARQKILGVALESMQTMRPTQSPEEQKVLADLMRIYRRRQLSLKGKAASAENNDNAWRWRHYQQLVRQVRGVERAEISKMRDGNEVSDEVLRRLERELDLQDLRYSEEER